MHMRRCDAVRHRCSTASSESAVGLGYCSAEISGVSRTNVFKAMMNRIDAPGRFISVPVRVHVRPAEGAAGDDGALWRSVAFDGGEQEGTTVVEHVYTNPSKGEIRFVALEADGRTEANLEIVNALLKSPLRIEYFCRDRNTLQRVHWDEPRARVSSVIDATVALAKVRAAISYV